MSNQIILYTPKDMLYMAALAIMVGFFAGTYYGRLKASKQGNTPS